MLKIKGISRSKKLILFESLLKVTQFERRKILK